MDVPKVESVSRECYTFMLHCLCRRCSSLLCQSIGQVGAVLALLEGPDAAQGDLGDVEERLLGQERHMGGHDDVWERRQARENLVLEYLV